MKTIKHYLLIGVAIAGFALVQKLILEPRAEAAVAEAHGLDDSGMDIYRSCKTMMTDKEFTTGGSTNDNCGCIASASAEKLEPQVRFAFAKHLETAKHDDAHEVMPTILGSIQADKTPESLPMIMALSHALSTCLKGDS